MVDFVRFFRRGARLPAAFRLLLWIGLAAVRFWSPDAVTAEDSPPPARTMRVHVKSEEGGPLEGVKIHAGVWTKAPFKANRDYLTNAAGEAVIELPQSIEILRLWATDKSRVGMFAQWWPENEKRRREIPPDYTFELANGTTIGGIVTNDAGEPISGAKVAVQLTQPRDESVLDRQAIPTCWLAEGDALPTTDADGRWTVDNVPAGEHVEVKVLLTHPDYISESQWGSLQSAQGVTMEQFRDQSATIAMRSGVRLTGFVLDQNRNRVEGAVVIWGDDPYLETGSQEVRTNAKGQYRLPPLPEGKIKVTVVAEGWAPQQQEIDMKTERSTLSFKLDPGKTLRIRFVEGNDRPVPQVSVGIHEWRGAAALYNHRHPNVLNTKIPHQADEAGVYEWTWAPEDVVRYGFYKEGYAEVRDAEFIAGETYVVRLRRTKK